MSLSCQAPATQCLTEIILKGQNVHRHTDCTYIVSETFPSLYDPANIEQIRRLLVYLESHTNCFFQQEQVRTPTANYEDVYYLVAQLADAVQEYENPALSELLHRVRTQFEVERNGWNLLDEAKNYIRGIICHYLDGLQPTSRHLAQIVQAAQDASVSKIEVFTLNHDLLIEEVLNRAGIQFEDGFVPIHDDLRRWDRKKFAMSPRKVRLSKLHGSINWHPVRFSGSEASCTCIGKRGNATLEQSLLHDDPEMLIGTFNKMLEYTMGIHADLFCFFRASLAEIDQLVVSGYSFSDKGINATIAQWIRESPERRVLIVAPKASKFSETARGEIRRVFESNAVQIETWDAKFEKVTWPEIHRKLVEMKGTG